MNKMNADSDFATSEMAWTHAALGVVILDAETETIVAVNPAGATLLGEAAPRLVGRRWRDFCHDGAASGNVTGGSAPSGYRERTLSGSGGPFPVISFVSEIHRNGRPALLECFADVSAAKKHAGQTLLESRIAREASQARSALLSRMGREIRTPLTAIASMANTAASVADIDILRQCLSTIHLSAAQVLGLLDDVLEKAQIETGTFVLETVPFNLETMVHKVCSSVMDRMEEKDITFTVHFSENMNLWFAGDEYRLSQIMANLLVNAMKFTPPGGRVDLAVTELRRGGSSGFVQLRVSDTGIGMSAAQVDTLFTGFEEKDRFVPGRFGGSGLGLAISRRILERMKGSITVTSAPGRGTDCIVTLALPRVPGKNAESPAVSGLNVLVADPDAETRELFAFLRADGKNRVDEAGTGAEAVRAILDAENSGHPYDAVFVAHDLGDMTAVDLAENLDFATVLRSVVLMASFRRWSRIDTEAYGVGIEAFIPKPLFPGDIVKTLRKVTGEPENGVSEIPPALGLPDFSHLTLLVVDDIARNRETFASLLSGTNARVVSAENGIDAVEKFHADPCRFKGIFMDLEMPGMDGFDAAKTIRALPVDTAGQVPILAMTADVFAGDMERCFACGMNGHIPKPLDGSDLIRKILDHCA